jgi:hypothetical protein
MHTSSIELYDLLKTKLGDNEARTLVTFIEVENKFEQKKDTLATKVDIANVKADLIKWMFIFIVGQTTVTIGVMIAVLQLFFK